MPQKQEEFFNHIKKSLTSCKWLAPPYLPASFACFNDWFIGIVYFVLFWFFFVSNYSNQISADNLQAGKFMALLGYGIFFKELTNLLKKLKTDELVNIKVFHLNDVPFCSTMLQLSQQKTSEGNFYYKIIFILFLVMEIGKQTYKHRQVSFYHQQKRISRDLWLFFLAFQTLHWAISPQSFPQEATFFSFFIVYEFLGLISSITRCVSFSVSQNKFFEICYFQIYHSIYMKILCLPYYNHISHSIVITTLIQMTVYLFLHLVFHKKIIRIYYWDQSRRTALRVSAHQYLCFDQPKILSLEQFCRKASLFDKLKVEFDHEICNKCALRKVDVLQCSCWHASLCSVCRRGMEKKHNTNLGQRKCLLCERKTLGYYHSIIPMVDWNFWVKETGAEEDQTRIKNQFRVKRWDE